jgi:hypothetical protein
MKNLLHRAVFVVSVVAAAAICQAQSNVYSINGLVLGSFLPAPHRSGEVMVSSYTYSEAGSASARAEWYVSTNTLAKQPRWDGFSVEYPLSLRKACALAVQHARERFPEVQSWSLKSACLRNPYPDDGRAYPDVWCYEITLTPRDPEVRTRIEGQTTFGGMQTVLLDGTVVPVTVLKKK